jgi:hypothetical protein
MKPMVASALRAVADRNSILCFFCTNSESWHKKNGGIAQLVEQTAHIRSVIGPSPIAAIVGNC